MADRGSSHANRAPRLAPDEYIARHITRLGRFRAINPLKPRPLPGVAKVLGVVGWAVFVEETMRRAWLASRVPPAQDRPPE